MVDIRLTLEGSEIIWGVPLAQLSRAGPKAKMSSMSAMSADAFSTLAKDHGFVYISTAGSAVALPSNFGYVILNDSSANTVHGLRRLVPGSKKRLHHTKRMLKGLMRDYPTLANTAHSSLLNYLNTQVQ